MCVAAFGHPITPGHTEEMALSERFDAALTYASTLHRTQIRKGANIPYVSHLLAVTSIVLEYGGNEDQAIAALLHDAVEDQGGPPILAEIRVRWGDDVAAIVDACTDADTIPKPPWRERKETYIAHLAHATPAALLVSAADKLHNSRSILRDFRLHGDSVWERFRGRRDGTLWYYQALADAFEARQLGPISGELRRTVDELSAEAAA